MNQDTIYQYLDGSLNPEAKAIFESALQSDPELASELALVKKMRLYSELVRKEENAHQVIRQIGQKYQPNPEVTQPKPKIKWLKYAVPAIAAMMLFGILLNSQCQRSEIDGPALYAKYSEVTPLSLSSRASEINEAIATAEQNFNQKKYGEAITSLTNLLAHEQENVKVVFYRGYAHIANGDLKSGRADLSSLLTNELYKNSALYHIGLSHIKSNEIDLAVSYFDQISANSNYYSRAQEILKKIY